MFRSRNRGLLGAVLWRVLPLSMAVMVVVWGVVVDRTRVSFEQETQERIKQHSESLATATDVRLTGVLAVVRNLAASSLLDPLLNGRTVEQTGSIETFLQTLRIAGLARAELQVVTLEEGGASHYPTELRQRVVSGQEFLYIDSARKRMLFVTPIERQERVKGGLLLEVERGVLMEYLGAPLPFGAMLLRRHDHAVLYSAIWGWRRSLVESKRWG